MFRNYLLTAVRSLLRHRFFSLINIFGLAVSMALSMCIIMLVADQMMYDRYNTNRDRIYRINSVVLGRNGERFSEQSTTSMPFRDELTQNYPGVSSVVRFKRGFGNLWLELGQNVNIPVAGYFADPEVFDVFQYELEYGDPRTALVEPYSVVLTRKTARKLFKQENPVGESFKVGVEGPYKVTGILKETDHKTHIAFDALASMATVKSLAAAAQRNRGIEGDASAHSLDNWYDYWGGWVYVLLEEGKTTGDLQPHLDAIARKHNEAITDPDRQHGVEYHLQSLMSITPGSVINNAIGPVLPWFFVYFFIALAGVVMLTSCFNFTNLSIARSLTRAREIGVRKVTGAARWQIFVQFLTESVLVALVALVFSILLLVALKPLMMQLSFARLLRWDLEINYVVALIFLMFAVTVGLLAGTFPAVVLSGFQPVKVLKNLNTLRLFSGIRLRKALLVAQFTFSLVFILSVIVVFNQLQLFLRADHGFSMENKVIVSLNNANPDALKAALSNQSQVVSVSAASHVPAAGFNFGAGYKKSMDEKEWTDISYFSVDEDYLRHMNVTLKSGRFFRGVDGASNKNFIVLNEAAVEAFHLGSPEEAVGQELIARTDSSRLQIIGVVRNYNHEMLMEKLSPMALIFNPEEFRILQVEYTGTMESIGKTIEAEWAKINPTLQVDYKDFSSEVHKMYDVLFGDLVSLLTVIAILAIFISCLGLLGMATYATETRLKEISIRKVLGSSNGSLIYLLSKGFLVILIIAILLAVPAAYFINNLWLEQLAYHVSVDLATIGLGVLALVFFGTLTIGSQTWRAAYINPVDNLKSE
ncbi:MAG: ABC transporter permease [Cyclobacteriaceae bacterium]|nr:ABC transporter permease [Cyclobacteriaceae bacterium]